MNGHSFLIGRDKIKNRLIVATNVNGKIVASMIGPQNAALNGVSRIIPAEGKMHCMLTIGNDGSMRLENKNDMNITAVDGTTILSKAVTTADTIELGTMKYAITMAEVLKAAKALVATGGTGGTGGTRSGWAAAGGTGSAGSTGGGCAGAVGTGGGFVENKLKIDITPLRDVWEDYKRQQREIKERQRRINLLRGLAPVFSIGSGAVTFVGGRMDWDDSIIIVGGVMTGIGLLLMIYSVWRSFCDNSIEESDRITERFQSEYCCPNPQCRRFMGNTPYKILLQHERCPYCKGEWITS